MSEQKFGRFYGLLNCMPGMDKDELKKSLVRQFTGGRTESLRSMRVREYETMCDELQRRVRASESMVERERRQWRSAVLHQLQLLGVNTADWTCVNKYCLDKRIAGKLFRELSVAELEALMPKLRAIRAKMRKALIDK